MPSCQPPSRLRCLLAGLLLVGSGVASGVERPPRYEYQTDQLRLRLIPRSPQQIRAFYEARGFPPAALDELARACFITVGIRNRSRQIIWHDVRDWRITRAGRPVQPYRREWWQRRWEALGIRPGLRATFRWTLLPETLDFRPDEGEGGNLILPRESTPLRIEALFHTAPNHGGKTIRIVAEDIPCAED